ncbi:PDZ domain-containing protein [Amphritea balenae]|uniref:PDZ domain-containing protein n=1 Tax=Amphritea balenae TaxID=452629 RepID=A0A3P1SP64_9GAMM|nr:PDZ domain-containing protein [Amphritea balenae]RRC98819.1 hypothetical protein EHS89_11560 [Amphritea balenae]
MSNYFKIPTICFLLLCFLSACTQIKTQTIVRQNSPGSLGILISAQPIEGRTPALAFVRVAAVLPDSAADKGGLRIGDVLTELNGISLEKPSTEAVSHFRELLKGKGAGEKLTLQIRRRVVSTDTFLDNSKQSTPQAYPLADPLSTLDRLLDQHPDQLVELRTKGLEQKQQIEVVLTSRFNTAEPLPLDSSAVDPQLNQQSLLPEAELTKRILGIAETDRGSVQEQFDQLLERFNQDERIDDPFRLRTIRYLHRKPLKLANATHNLGSALRSVHSSDSKGPNFSLMLETVRRHLDSPKEVLSDSEVPVRPVAGGSAEEHGRYLLALINQTELHVARAFSRLSEPERSRLKDSLPTLADKFAQHLYLHVDNNRLRWQQHMEVIQLLPKIDRSELLTGLEVLLESVKPDYLTQLKTDLKSHESNVEQTKPVEGINGRVLWHSGQDIVIGGSGDNVYKSDFSVVIDLGGDDRYRAAIGAGRPYRPVALVIDLAGNDRYQSDKPFSQGTGFMGIGVLYDLEGDDSYTSNQSFAQGSALAGAGLLIDRAGNDRYRGVRYAQASALSQGIGAVLDGAGQDSFSAGAFAQGFAGPGAFGALISRGGDDRYVALGLDRSSYPDGVGIYKGMSQGVGVGFRFISSGGIGVLLDDGGTDFYEAGNFSQGGGYYFGWGLLIDMDTGPDRYEGARYAQGFAAHSALGSFWDQGGNDIYQGWVGAANSAAWDLSATVFIEESGNDTYQPGPGFSLGASAHNGFALFVDHNGKDLYRFTPGRSGPNSYHGGSSISVFIDAGGQTDRYESGGLSDGQGKVKGETGILLDLPGAIESVDDLFLERSLSIEEIQASEFIGSE